MPNAHLPALFDDFTRAANNFSASHPEVHEVLQESWDFAKEIGHLIVADQGKALLALAVGAVITHRVAQYKTRKAIMHGNFENDNAVLGETIYTPSGELNPDTGEEFVDQRLRTLNDRIELEKIFPPPHDKTMTRYLLKAAKYCTADDPVVFNHLHKVIKKPEELEQTKRIIGQSWTNYFSQILGDGVQHAVQTKAGPRQRHAEREFLPVLTMETDAVIRKLRVFLMAPEQLDFDQLPQPENLRLEQNHGTTFVHDPVHPHAQRIRSYRQIAAIISSPEGAWIRDCSSVRVATGALIDIPPPKPEI